jgi:hypothetical protein
MAIGSDRREEKPRTLLTYRGAHKRLAPRARIPSWPGARSGSARRGLGGASVEQTLLDPDVETDMPVTEVRGVERHVEKYPGAPERRNPDAYDVLFMHQALPAA